MPKTCPFELGVASNCSRDMKQAIAVSVDSELASVELRSRIRRWQVRHRANGNISRSRFSELLQTGHRVRAMGGFDVGSDEGVRYGFRLLIACRGLDLSRGT